MADQQVALDSVPMAEFKRAREAAPVVEEESTTVEQPEKKEAEPAKEEKQHNRGGFQKRIERLTRQVSTVEEENTKLKEQLAKRPNGDAKTEETSTPGEPQREQFESDSAYTRALVKWEIKQEQAQEQEKTAAEERRERAVSYNQRAIEAQARYDDWDEIVGKNTEPVPSSVNEPILFEMENGPDVLYYLGQHPEVCRGMMEVSPSKAVAMAWKISDELTGTKKEEGEDEEIEAKEEKEPVKVKSKAPAPIRPLTGGSTRTNVPLDRMAMKDYKRARDAGKI